MLQKLAKFQFTEPVTADQLNRFQTQLLSALNPLTSIPLLNGNLLTDVSLKAASPTPVNHGLGRAPQGWLASAPQAPAEVYQAASQPNPTLQLVLSTTADVTLDLWVY